MLKLRERGCGIGFGMKSVRRVRVCKARDGVPENEKVAG